MLVVMRRCTVVLRRCFATALWPRGWRPERAASARRIRSSPLSFRPPRRRLRSHSIRAHTLKETRFRHHGRSRSIHPGAQSAHPRPGYDPHHRREPQGRGRAGFADLRDGSGAKRSLAPFYDLRTRMIGIDYQREPRALRGARAQSSASAGCDY
jgi:hypothetical protein